MTIYLKSFTNAQGERLDQETFYGLCRMAEFDLPSIIQGAKEQGYIHHHHAMPDLPTSVLMAFPYLYEDYPVLQDQYDNWEW